MELNLTNRVSTLKNKMLEEERYLSIEQAQIITQIYKENEEKSVALKRALSLKATLENLEIDIQNEELIVGNRTKGVRGGVVFPESGIGWIHKEIETIQNRPQDKFNVHPEDIHIFRKSIEPYWREISLEAAIKKRYGTEISEIEKVVKINQKDHAQGHICPNCEKWLKFGPSGILAEAKMKIKNASKEKKEFYESVIIVMEGVQTFMLRYRDLLYERSLAESDEALKSSMKKLAEICEKLSFSKPESFHEAVQSIWFLFVVLQMESNASSFSPGRMDQYLHQYYKNDMENGNLTKQEALEIIECVCIKFNQIVYMRNSHSAKFFAGFPIGFNIVIGGQDEKGNDATNELSYLFLTGQKHLLLPQPNLSVRLHNNTPGEFLKECVRVVALGNGMPQFFNDQSVMPALRELNIEENDVKDYAVVGCVEITTQGNNLGWSDAAMFNLNKVLELTLNHGKCLITGKQMAPDQGSLSEFETYEDLEKAFESNIKYFIGEMISSCEVVEKAHMDLLPSPFLSAVVDDCMEKGIDITCGGAKYNLSGIQMIQVANLADSLGAIKSLVFDRNKISRFDMLNALQNNYEGNELMRAIILNKSPKYGNDVKWIDEIGAKWAEIFKSELSNYKNYRGGKYHTGMYTVSAHVPMGENVGASPDGRYAMSPLADGGMSPVYGRDTSGPTAVLKSVARLDNNLTSNGGLLNMKFLPEFFSNESGIDKFSMFLRAFVDLEIPHIQFNVIRKEDLIAAKKDPENYRGLTVRVAGYTAYFTELADELQNEIIARTSYGDL
ncbi:MAG: formate C-acetyltransferase/glycerol dehydratase family glycyl radical enzyme [Eubacteriaceae bacterium]|nr:formate C-acetyltransferase/glycerol dehydratase family glycyl radical enzyme [Eubacteriaceae bacterium]